MDAIKLLKQQHREVEALFKSFDKAEEDEEKKRIFFAIADALAVHANIEERFFYPATEAKKTADDLEEAYDEHLEIKKLILDGLKATERPGFDGFVAALKGAVEHHVKEEEEELFPKAKKVLDSDALEAVGQRMEAEAEMLKSAGSPRNSVKVASEQPAI